MTLPAGSDGFTPTDRAYARYRVGDLLIDVGRQRVTRADVEIALPKLSFELLVTLVRAAPNLVSGDRLIAQVWPKAVVSPETLNQRVKLLRDALGDDPHRPRYVEGLRGRGYRLVPEVETLPVDSCAGAATLVATPAVVVPDSVASRSPWRRGFRRWVLTGLSSASLLLLVLGWLGVHYIGSGALDSRGADVSIVPEAQSRTVAVLPFESLGTAGDVSIAVAVSDAVQHRLASAPHLRVVARSTAHALGRRYPDAREAGRLLGVRYIVDGRLQRDGRIGRVTVELIDTETRRVLRSLQIEGDVDALFLFQDRVADAIVREVERILRDDFNA